MGLIATLEVNVDRELREVENCLRDNIYYILKDKYGNNWEKHLAVSEDRIKIWNERLLEEQKKLKGKQLDSRLLYYSDFYDLKTIIINNWTIFKEIFKSKKEIEYQLDTLNTYRNPNAHNRELLSHQKHFLMGISGEIKMNIMEYKGNIENENTYFPSVESVQINGIHYPYTSIELKKVFKKGEKIEITLFCLTPPDQKIFYAFSKNVDSLDWVETNTFTYQIDNELKYGRNTILVFIKSDKDYHKISNNNQEYDGVCVIEYLLVP